MIKSLKQDAVVVDYFDKNKKVIHEWITTSPVVQEDIEEVFSTSHKANVGEGIHFEAVKHEETILVGDFVRKKDRGEVDIELTPDNYTVLTKIANEKNMSLEELISSMAASSAHNIFKQ